MMPQLWMHLRAAACAAAVACAVWAAGPLAGASAAWHDSSRPALHGVSGQPWSAPGASGYSATLEACVTSAVALERSLTVSGQMIAMPGVQRMGMRVELQQRVPGDAAFHTVVSPGLGVWRGSEGGVKIYRYVKQVTNLSAPAVYRAVVHFRWIGERGRVVRREELRTARCTQPLLAPSSPASA